MWHCTIIGEIDPCEHYTPASHLLPLAITPYPSPIASIKDNDVKIMIIREGLFLEGLCTSHLCTRIVYGTHWLLTHWSCPLPALLSPGYGAGFFVYTFSLDMEVYMREIQRSWIFRFDIDMFVLLHICTPRWFTSSVRHAFGRCQWLGLFP